MVGVEFEVCTDCWNPNAESESTPRDVDECAACGGHVTDLELDDLIGL